MNGLVLADASGAGYVVAAIALTCVALALFFAEVFIPSFGLISLVALGCMAGSVALAYRAGGPGVMYLFIVLNALAIPIVAVVAFKLLPKSPLVLSQTFEDEHPRSPAVESDQELVGKEGVAETDLRPAGKARIDGRRVDVLTAGEYIEPGTRVKVVRVEGARVFVRTVRG